jgi:hypothetical protein
MRRQRLWPGWRGAASSRSASQSEAGERGGENRIPLVAIRPR